MAQKKFYAVKIGKIPGIYSSWAECQEQISGFPGAVFKGFALKEEAEAFLGFAPKPKAPLHSAEKVSSFVASAPKKKPALHSTHKTYEKPQKKQYYIVKRGWTPGVYTSWVDCQKQVSGYQGALFKGFVTKEEAEAWYGKPISIAPAEATAAGKEPIPFGEALQKYPARAHFLSDFAPAQSITMYTDGSCLVNPNGPGGFAAVIVVNEEAVVDIIGGEPVSTNNRMELRAAYEGLRFLEHYPPLPIHLHTDSKYLQRAITEGWLMKWKRNGWKTSAGTPVANQDMWMALDEKLSKHQITFHWVKGHAGTKFNERCDMLAGKEALKWK